MKNKLTITLLICSLIIASCSKKDEEPDIKLNKINYSLVTEVGTYPDKIFYLKGLESLETEEISNDGALELTSIGFGYSYKGALFQSNFGAPAKLTKYTFNDEGVPIEQGKFADVTSHAFAKLVFVNDNEAYAHNLGKGSYKIIKFNPTTMDIIGEVNLEKLKRKDAKFIGLQGMEYKDGKLYVGVAYSNRAMMLPSAFEGISVALIDLSKMEVSKIITDKRFSGIYGSVRSFKKDNNGDLYIMAQGTHDSPNGLLRIKKGEDDFDKEYSINLEQEIGSCKNIMFYGTGKMLVMRLENTQDYWEMKGPSYKYCKLDYINKKNLGDVEDLPMSYETGALLEKDENGYILNSAQKNESVLYRFNEKDEKVTKITKVNSNLKSLHVY